MKKKKKTYSLGAFFYATPKLIVSFAHCAAVDDNGGRSGLSIKAKNLIYKTYTYNF